MAEEAGLEPTTFGFGGHQNLSSKIMKSSKTKEKNYFIH